MRPSTFIDPNAAPRRATEVRRLRRVLLRTSWPRLQMALIVALTAGAGLLASFALQAAGMQAMAWRYPSAVLLAYLVFLGLLRLWLHGSHEVVVDTVDAASELMPRGDRAEAALDAGLADGSDAGGEAGLLDALGGADEGLPLLLFGLLLALAAALLLALASVVWTAPTLFAELLFDGALAAGLYRRLRRADRRHWLESALRGTARPFLATLLSSAVLGAVLHWFAPHATTLAQVFGG